MRILVLNSGSSSLKFKVIDVAAGEANLGNGLGRPVVRGAVNGIGGSANLCLAGDDEGVSGLQRVVPDHEQAVRWLFERLPSLLVQVEAVGHRVVHGGDQFDRSVRIDADVLKEIGRVSELAPLHNPKCLAAIQGAQTFLGTNFPMVAVFDTTFHRTMPAYASNYAIPGELAARHGIRRYGFHGIAHASMAAGYSTFTGKPLGAARLITLHLGNGCSIAAIQGGRSADTSMGFTPLEGLVMGTRSGDLDPAIIGHLARREGVNVNEVERWLNQRSGLLGVSGSSHDMRDLLAAAQERQDPCAILAIDMFCYRARKYVGAYLAALGGADAVIFGGGIGEQAPVIRARICAGMDWCGLVLDPSRNAAASDIAAGGAARISFDDAALPAYVIPVDEETWIARETVRCLRAGTRVGG